MRIRVHLYHWPRACTWASEHAHGQVSAAVTYAVRDTVAAAVSAGDKAVAAAESALASATSPDEAAALAAELAATMKKRDAANAAMPTVRH